MKKKLFVWVMAIVLAFSSLSIVAFADEDTGEHYPNYSVDVDITNDDCKYFDSSELDIKLNVTFSGESVVIPVTYDSEYEWYYVEGYSELLRKLIETKSTDFTAEVIIEDNDLEHNFQTDTNIDVDIYTKQEIIEDLNELANFMIGMIYEIIVEENDTESLAELEAALGGTITMVDDVAMLNGAPLTFQDLVNAFKNNAEALGLGEEGLAAIKEYEDMMASEDFIGSADFVINLKCDCTEMLDYCVNHEYYDKNGEMIDFDANDYTVEAGTVINISDIPLVEKCDGKTYKFEGAYLYNDDYDLDLNNPITEFTVNEDFMEIGFKYVLVSSNEGGSKTDDSTTTPDNKTNDKTPETGDSFNTSPFMLLMLLAAFGAVITITTRKRA